MSSTPATHRASAPPRRGRRAHRWIGVGLALVVVVAVFGFVLPRVADYGAVWAAVSDIGGPWDGALVAVAVINLATFAPPWMAGIPGLSYWRATVMTQASTAASAVLPGGDALGAGISFAMLRRWGFAARQVAVGVGATSLWNMFANVTFPLVALLGLALTGSSNALLQRVTVIGALLLLGLVAALAFGLSSRGRAHRLGDRAGRLTSYLVRHVGRGPVCGWGPALADTRDLALDLLRARWLALTAATIAGHLTVFGVLLVALRAVGVSGAEVSALEAFAAWSLIRLLTAVPVTPGGLGVVELGLTAALVGFGGGQVEVVSAVLVYRFLTYVPPIAIGGVCILLTARWDHRAGAGGQAAAGDSRPGIAV